jgi:hypothetical protein
MTLQQFVIGWWSTTVFLLLASQAIFYVIAACLRNRIEVYEMLLLYKLFMWILMLGGLSWIALT